MSSALPGRVITELRRAESVAGYYTTGMSYKEERRRLLERQQALAGAPLTCAKQIKETEIKLKVLESNRLREKAKKWGIDLVEAVGPWETDANSTRSWISQDKHYAQAARIISDTRFAYWKKWVDVISPVASVVISLLAFVLAALALCLQLVGRLR